MSIVDPSTGDKYDTVEVVCDCGTSATIPASNIVDYKKPQGSMVVVEGKCITCGRTLRVTATYTGKGKSFKIGFDVI